MERDEVVDMCVERARNVGDGGGSSGLRERRGIDRTTRTVPHVQI